MAAQVERQPLVAEQAVQVDVLAGVVAGVDGRAPGLGFAAAVVFADVADVAAVAEAGAQCEGRAEAIVGADAQPSGLELETAGAAPRGVIAEAHRTGSPDREHDRKGGGWGKGVSVRVDRGGGRLIKKKK